MTSNGIHLPEDSVQNGSASPNRALQALQRKQSWLRLNVGGKVYLTTRMTLCRDPQSFFYRLLQEDPELPSAKDDDGAFMIDRDSEYFAVVLNYLRHGKLILNKNLTEEGVLAEAEFYNLAELIDLCKAQIALRNGDLDGPNKEKRSTVYRVLQYHEDELTSHISDLSDGWKFEQLVQVSPQYASDSSASEYLCIVSKDYPERSTAKTSQPRRADSGESDGSGPAKDRGDVLQQRARRH